jgi:hypothetical protein
VKRIRTDPANGAPEGDERCPGCGGDARDTWFDRSLCPCDGTDWGVMHQRCANCGYAEDCGFDNQRLRNQSAATHGGKP